jgi:PhnB protein
MPTQPSRAAVKAAESGVHSLSPHLVCAGAADAIDFYKEGLGAEELIRMPGPDGKLMHACISINGSSVMLVDEFPDHGVLSPKSLGGTPASIHLIVDDADAAIARAEKAGATVVMAPHDAVWGDRFGQIEDPFGHRWSFSTPQRTVAPEEMKEIARTMNSECGQAPD